MPFLNLRVSFYVWTLLIIFQTKEAHLQEKVIEVGEELKYELSYGFIKLGYIKFILSGSHKDDKKLIYNAKLEVKSYPEVPFIKINQIFETEMVLDGNELVSEKFYETSFRDKSISRSDYKFNFSRGLVKINKDTDGKIEK